MHNGAFRYINVIEIINNNSTVVSRSVVTMLLPPSHTVAGRACRLWPQAEAGVVVLSMLSCVFLSSSCFSVASFLEHLNCLLNA